MGLRQLRESGYIAIATVAQDRYDRLSSTAKSIFQKASIVLQPNSTSSKPAISWIELDFSICYPMSSTQWKAPLLCCILRPKWKKSRMRRISWRNCYAEMSRLCVHFSASFHRLIYAVIRSKHLRSITIFDRSLSTLSPPRLLRFHFISTQCLMNARKTIRIAIRRWS